MLILFAAGCLALAAESALLAQLPAALVPALSLLFPVAAAVLLGPIEGLVVCAALGFGADMFSGALLGQHAFLRLVEFALVRALVGQLDLRRPLPFSIFAFGVALADAAGSAVLIRFFLGELVLDTHTLGVVALRSLATATAAPLVLALARRVAEWGGQGETRREMRLETKRPVI
jgi:rod shape-determining protein MreD